MRLSGAVPDSVRCQLLRRALVRRGGAAAVLLGCALLLRGRRSQRALERWRLARPIVCC
ncbi:MAG: hypothetical protein ACLSVD_04640 [Eggerthellaceae bacterium]